MAKNDKQKKLYDAACKKVLSEKGIIANILRTCVSEFEDYSVSDIVNNKYIQGTPEVSVVTVEPDGAATRIENQQTEDKSEKEGTVYYDIRFSAIAPSNNKPIELIINIEAQNDFYPGYPLLKRAIYYCSRLISSQYGTVFVKSHYEKIQKVYSIWICTNPAKEWEYTITRYQMQEQHIVGKATAKKENYNLIVPIIVCLGSKHYTDLTGLLRMLNLVLLDSTSSQNKTEVLSREFDIQITPHLEKGVAEMCNLSEGVEKRAKNEERLKNLRSLIKNMKISAEQAMNALNIPISERSYYEELLNTKTNG